MALMINGVYQRGENLYRLLRNYEGYCWLYPLGSRGVKYEVVPVQELIDQMDKGDLVEVADPYEAIVSRKLEGATYSRAEENWKIIKELVTNPKVLYSLHERTTKMAELQKLHGVSHMKIYRLLVAWWEGGQCPGALNPAFGSADDASKDNKTKTARGELLAEFDKAFHRYLLKEGACSVSQGYQYFLGDYRTAHPEIDAADFPTMWQFRYAFRKLHGRREVKRKQSGQAVWDKDLRPLGSSVYEIVKGPGMRYEIDSTEADVELVSELNRNALVGRPTLYIVTDTYSGLITGMNVTLDDPQFKCAADALYSAFTPKETQCADVGVQLQPGEWPAIGIPTEIVADNAELKTWKIESFGRQYGVQISHTAPYRADMKGTTESLLGVVQNTLKGLTPGVPEKKRSKKAGYRERRTEATLTLKEYRKLVVLAILQANRRIREIGPPGLGFPPPRAPLNIWKKAEQAGLAHLAVTRDLGKLRLTLLPAVKCTLSRKGILADGIRYWCEEACKAGLFDRQTGEGRPDGGSLSYDPSNISRAWYYPEPLTHPHQCWECRLAPESEALAGTCWREAHILLALARKAAALEKADSLDRTTELTVEEQKIIRNAKDLQPESRQSNASKLAKMQQNRRLERVRNEKGGSRIPIKSKDAKPAKKKPSKAKEVLFNSMGYPQRVEDIPD